MVQPQQPIGIFDSGIGGLTVASALAKALPNERFLYFGDTAHLPYGEKSKSLITEYSVQITLFLLEKDIKHLVIACNSASAAAYESVRALCAAHGVAVTNVIDPVVEFIQQKKFKHVGIIGTKATISSGIFQEKLKPTAGLEVHPKSTPLLAAMIEEGFAGTEVSRGVLKSYLSDPILRGIEAIALACTHYPLIASEVRDYFGGEVSVLDTAQIVAEHVKNTLTELDLLASSQNEPHEFFVSDLTESFKKSTQLFFGTDVLLKAQKL
jgi:glutamate racemase